MLLPAAVLPFRGFLLIRRQGLAEPLQTALVAMHISQTRVISTIHDLVLDGRTDLSVWISNTDVLMYSYH